MADPIDFVGVNLILGPPEGMTEDEVRRMPVFKGEGYFVSCWQLNPEELKEVTRTGNVWLAIMGNVAQPSFVGSEETVVELLYGPNNG